MRKSHLGSEATHLTNRVEHGMYSVIRADIEALEFWQIFLAILIHFFFGVYLDRKTFCS